MNLEFLRRSKVSKKLLIILLAFIGIGIFRNSRWNLNWVQQNAANGFENTIKTIVNTRTCQIPDFDAWDPSISSALLKTEIKAPECERENKKWSHVDFITGEVVMNTEKVKRDGYRWKSLKCCYSIIKRKGDKRIITAPCKKFVTRRVKIPGEFVTLQCTMESKLIYRMFHALLPTLNLNDGINIKEVDPKYPKEKLPNVIILGQDSTSRLNFRRFMKKTRIFLESIGAFEMLGHVKVGDNTFPNTVPILTGFGAENITAVCKNRDGYFDTCPFIWNDFKGLGYLTAELDDDVYGGIFVYMKKGFRNPPVDFYPRPIFISAYRPFSIKLEVDDSIFNPCIGYQTNSEFMLQYLEASVEYSGTIGKPLFAFSWSTSATHDDPKGLESEDETYVTFLKKFQESGQLNNTILILMGDHGYRFGEIRQTLIGSYEDNLPNLWIYLPPWIRKTKPEWVNALKHNSKQLTSHYMLYWMLQDIIGEVSEHGKMSTQSSNNETDSKANTGGIPRKFKHSLLKPLPVAGFSCGDLGIPEEYCPCHAKTPLNISAPDPLLSKAVSFMMDHLNNHLIDREKCSQLILRNIISGVIINLEIVNRYVISFNTKPGDATFEAEIDYNISSKSFAGKGINVKRTNKINKEHVKCIKDFITELYCYCK